MFWSTISTWISTPVHILWTAIGTIAVAFLGAIGTRTDTLIFGVPEPKKKFFIRRYPEKRQAIFEVVNESATLEIEIRRHGVRYYDGKGDIDSGFFSTRLKPGEHLPLNVSIKEQGLDGTFLLHAFKYHGGDVYLVYVEESTGQRRYYYPDGRFRAMIKRFWYWFLNKELPQPHTFKEFFEMPTKHY
jgi:hypothetical protein